MKRLWVILAVTVLTGAESRSPALDRNGNQLSDIWETLYAIPAGADPTSDTDGDGQTLFQEAQFGTDPDDPSSATRATLTPGPADTLTLRLGTQPGKRYQIESSGDLIGWQHLGPEFTGDGTAMDVLGLSLDSLSPERQFLRVLYAGEIDADGDGLTAWEEARLGLSDTEADFDEDGLDDGWEVGYGLDPHDDGTVDPANGPLGDPDGDGLLNIEESFNQLSPQTAEELIPGQHVRYLSIDIPFNDAIGLTNRGEVVSRSGLLFRPGHPPVSIAERAGPVSHSGLVVATNAAHTEAGVYSIASGQTRHLAHLTDSEILALHTPYVGPPAAAAVEISREIFPSALSESGLVAGRATATVHYRGSAGGSLYDSDVERTVVWDLSGAIHILGGTIAAENPSFISDRGTVFSSAINPWYGQRGAPLEWTDWSSAPTSGPAGAWVHDVNGRGEKLATDAGRTLFFEGLNETVLVGQGVNPGELSYLLNDAVRSTGSGPSVEAATEFTSFIAALAGPGLWRKSLEGGRYVALSVPSRVLQREGGDGIWWSSGIFDLNDHGAMLTNGYFFGQLGLPSIFAMRLLLPVELMVDGNRDGEMSFDTASVHDKDGTTKEKPYRFWLNNDNDKGHIVDLNDWEEDDVDDNNDGQIEDHDRTNDIIEWRRDLEDFTRLWISFKGITEMVKQTDFKVKLEWKPTNGQTWTADDGNPGIRVFKAFEEQDGGRQYLEDDGTAWQQLDGAQGPSGHTNFSKALGTNAGLVTRNSTVELPADFLSSLSESQPNKYLLFEGYSAGKGQLILTLYKGTQKVGEYPPVYLELKDTKEMYERWGVGDAQNPGIDWNVWPAATPTLLPAPSGKPLAAPPDETKDCILFVHGWQMSPADKDNFGDTTFKRLWHRGFKGRFVCYRWPTFYAMSASDAVAHFDASEQRAWNSGNGLVALADNLNGRGFSGKVRVMAHSHGNLVVGAALRQVGNRRIFHTYVASQAAIAAHCYNPNTPLMNFNSNPKTTPNVHGYYWVQGTTLYPDQYEGASYPQFLHPPAMQGAAGKFINYYNPNDWALGFWQIDQQTKPNAGYVYFWNPLNILGAGRAFIHQPGDPQAARVLNFPEDTYEIYSYAAEAHSFPLGRSATVGGVFDNTAEVNLDARWSYGDKHKGHSAQFRSTNMLRWEYWEELLGSFDIRQP